MKNNCHKMENFAYEIHSEESFDSPQYKKHARIDLVKNYDRKSRSSSLSSLKSGQSQEVLQDGSQSVEVLQAVTKSNQSDDRYNKGSFRSRKCKKLIGSLADEGKVVKDDGKVVKDENGNTTEILEESVEKVKAEKQVGFYLASITTCILHTIVVLYTIPSNMTLNVCIALKYTQGVT